MIRPIAIALATITVLAFTSLVMAEEKPKKHERPPAVGEEAHDFKLKQGKKEFSLHEQLKKGPVVLLVLRGYPEYQCPVCSRQMDDYLSHAEDFAKHKAQVVLIYPGADEELAEKAEEFLDERKMPKHFHFLIDPDYTFTNQYALRWDAPRETAYPSTFVIDDKGVVRMAVVSRTHRGRTKAAEALKALQETTHNAQDKKPVN